MSRFPFPPVPNSWYAVAWSHDVPRGTVLPVRCFGQDLVVFRGEDGIPRVLDAMCPHLGANLGVGGKVVGNQIECPFHAWRFGGDGVCTHIPYSQNIPGKARVACWPVQEVNGHILTYFHRDKHEPTFEVPLVPGFGAAQWHAPTFHSVNVKTHVQEMNENIFDVAHFVKVHHYREMPTATEHIDGPHVRVALSGELEVLGHRFTAANDAYMHGAGWTVIHVTKPFELLVLVAKTPVEVDLVQHRFAICVRRQFGPAGWPFRAFITRQVIADVATDAAIWENKRYVERPLLVKQETGIATFRRWHQQFYSGRQEAGRQQDVA